MDEVRLQLEQSKGNDWSGRPDRSRTSQSLHPDIDMHYKHRIACRIAGPKSGLSAAPLF